MSSTAERIIEAAQEAVDIAKGDKPAASITVKGHRYVPAPDKKGRFKKSQLWDAIKPDLERLIDVSDRMGCPKDQPIVDWVVETLEALTLERDTLKVDVAGKTALLTQSERERIAHEDALDEALVTRHLGVFNRGDDARKALASILDWEQQVNLDPAVSSDAAALVDHGRHQVINRVRDALDEIETSAASTEDGSVDWDAVEAQEETRVSPTDDFERRITVTPEAFVEFLRLLDNPPEPTPGLKRLMAEAGRYFAEEHPDIDVEKGTIRVKLPEVTEPSPTAIKVPIVDFSEVREKGGPIEPAAPYREVTSWVDEWAKALETKINPNFPTRKCDPEWCGSEWQVQLPTGRWRTFPGAKSEQHARMLAADYWRMINAK